MFIIETQVFSRLKNNKSISNDFKLKFIFYFAFLLMLSSLAFNSPTEILNGMKKIILSPCHLITDYIAISNIGATLFNGGIMTLISAIVLKKNKATITGPIIAAVFTVCGFSFFGKNIYNSLPIMFGVYLYCLVEKVKFNKVLIISMFATALCPMVSFLTFSAGLSLKYGIIAGCSVGILIGFVISPLASSFLSFHQGYNLYNTGFTAGMIGMFLTGFLRMFDKNVEIRNIISLGNNLKISFFLFPFFLFLFILGFIINNRSFSGYKKLMNNTGRLIADFDLIYGSGITLINMAIMGTISTIYVLLIGGNLNGPILGAIFTIIGFSAFGNHPKNSIPILIGVYLAQFFNKYNPKSTISMITALFGTTLAPIAGEFGIIWGIIAGFFHVSMVMNIGYLHGGTNLYNNGFSGGFIAATIVPIIKSINNIIERFKDE
ncbi:DUF1576 domain-containing protein [Peptoniphilus mikwangii]|uniref:DUF1576 domain-containing protein n=1 Tax=Peptoniphilus mikwangii TaxID=1354300 RepID=UPI0009DB8C21|nr:DUF1576 domain-containing protein [Peptoniphilus mikwangii]